MKTVDIDRLSTAQLPFANRFSQLWRFTHKVLKCTPSSPKVLTTSQVCEEIPSRSQISFEFLLHFDFKFSRTFQGPQFLPAFRRSFAIFSDCVDPWPTAYPHCPPRMTQVGDNLHYPGTVIHKRILGSHCCVLPHIESLPDTCYCGVVNIPVTWFNVSPDIVPDSVEISLVRSHISLSSLDWVSYFLFFFFFWLPIWPLDLFLLVVPVPLVVVVPPVIPVFSPTRLTISSSPFPSLPLETWPARKHVFSAPAWWFLPRVSLGGLSHWWKVIWSRLGLPISVPMGLLTAWSPHRACRLQAVGKWLLWGRWLRARLWVSMWRLRGLRRFDRLLGCSLRWHSLREHRSCLLRGPLLRRYQRPRLCLWFFLRIEQPVVAGYI